MAKKRVELDADEAAQYFENTNQATPTIPQAVAEKIDDPVSSFALDLRASEWQRVDTIAAEMGVTRHEAAARAVRAFLKQHEAGEITKVKKARFRGHKMLRGEVQLIFLSAYFKIFDRPKSGS
jgi:hypothetical protein